MPSENNKPDFARITLKYKDLEAFAKAARTTINKGRMTLKSKKDMNEGERIILDIKILDSGQNVEVVSDIIQKVPAQQQGAANAYGVRWVNFTEKKLQRLTDKGPDDKKPQPAPAKKPAEKKAPEKPVKKQAPEPEKPPAGKEKAPFAPTKPAPPSPPMEAVENESYTIKEGETHPLFMEAREETAPETEKPDSVTAHPDLEPEDADTSLDVQQVEPEAPARDKAPLPPPPPGHRSDLAEGAGEAAPETPSIQTDTPAPQPIEKEETQEAGAPAGPDLPPPPPSYAPEIGEPDKVPGETAEAKDAAPPEEDILSADDFDEEIVVPPRPPGPEEETAAEPPPAREQAPAASEKAAAGEAAPRPAAPAEAKAEEPDLRKPMSPDELSRLAPFLSRFTRQVQKAEPGEPDTGGLRLLYQDFKNLMEERKEIGIYVRSAGAVREFMLAGDLKGPVNLKAAIPAEQFDELALKLVEFFKSKDLIGVQFGKYLTEEALAEFVNKIREYEPVGARPEELASELLGAGVFHATPVFASDRVSGAAGLDFQTDATLTRMRGELTRLDMLAEAIGEDPAALWTLRVEDALKAVSTAPLRTELLLNADKVVEGQDRISENDLMQEIVLATPLEMLREVAARLAGSYESLHAGLEAERENQDLKAELQKVRHVLRQVYARLSVEEPEAASEVMGGLYKKGVFTLEELPPELREQMMIEQFISFFMQDPDKRLADFSAIKNSRDYRNAVGRYARMIGELVRLGQVDAAEKIFKTLINHVKTKDPGFPERRQEARKAVTLLSNPLVMNNLIESLGTVEKGKREHIASMIFAAGPKAADKLIERLAVEEDRSLRRLICEILTRLKEPVAPAIVSRLADTEAPWYLTRNLIMILADMKSEAIKEDLEWHLNHKHPRVREEAMVYAAKVIGAQSEAMIVRMLGDPDPGVRRRAMRILYRFAELGDAAVLAVVESLEKPPPKDPSPEEEQVVAAGAELLSGQTHKVLHDGRTMEDVILGILESESKGLFGRIAGGRSGRTPRMKAALIEALGKAGTERSKKLLAGFMKDKDPLVKEAAQKAHTRISKT